MRQRLNVAARWLSDGEHDALSLDWPTIDYPAIIQLLGFMTGSYAPATQRLARAAIRGVMRQCWRLGQITAEELHTRIDDLSKSRGKRLPAGRAIEPVEFSQLLTVAAACGGTRAARNIALLTLLYVLGVRRSELVGLELSDVGDNGAVLVRKGKGGKERRAWIGDPRAVSILNRWIAIRGRLPGPLLCAVTTGGEVQPTVALRPARIQELIARWCATAGIPRCTPHDFRRTVATSLLDAGCDVDGVRLLLGHEHVQTTLAYRRSSRDLAREVAARIKLPD